MSWRVVRWRGIYTAAQHKETKKMRFTLAARQCENRGFTLIELLIVVIIVGVLAGVAVPSYLSYANRSRTAEAVTALGAIRRAQAEYKTEHGTFLAVEAGNIANPPHAAEPGLGLDFSNNAYFGNASFSVSLAGGGFIAEAFGGAKGNEAPRANEVQTSLVAMNHQGEVKYDFNAKAGGGSKPKPPPPVGPIPQPITPPPVMPEPMPFR